MRTEKSYSPIEVASHAGVSRRTVYTWIRSGILPAVKVGPKLWRITESALATFLQGTPSWAIVDQRKEPKDDTPQVAPPPRRSPHANRKNRKGRK